MNEGLLRDRRLIQWFLQRSTNWDLRVTEITGLHNLGCEVFDFVVDARIEGKLVTARARGKTKEVALAKAFTETAERSVFFSQATAEPSTNGLAAHVIFDEAVRNAALELIERDRFFCHWLTKTPFLVTVPCDEVEKAISGATNVYRFFHGRGWEICCTEMKGFVGGSAFVGAVFELATGACAIGLGAHSDRDKALRRAFLEGVSLGLRLIEKDWSETVISGEGFLRLDNPRLEDHVCAALHPDGGSRLRFLVDGAVNISSSSDEDPFEVIEVEEIPSPVWFEGSGLFFAQARASSLQAAFFGHLQPSVVNLDRLGRFLGRRVEFEDLETYPHPLG